MIYFVAMTGLEPVTISRLNSINAAFYQLNYTADRTIITPIGFHGPLELYNVAYQAATDGRAQSSPRFPSLFSPFLDIRAACSL